HRSTHYHQQTDTGRCNGAQDLCALHDSAAEARQNERQAATVVEMLQCQDKRHEKEEGECNVQVRKPRLIEEDGVCQHEHHSKTTTERRRFRRSKAVYGDQQQREKAEMHEFGEHIVLNEHRHRVQELNVERPVRIDVEGNRTKTTVGDV